MNKYIYLYRSSLSNYSRFIYLRAHTSSDYITWAHDGWFTLIASVDILSYPDTSMRNVSHFLRNISQQFPHILRCCIHNHYLLELPTSSPNRGRPFFDNVNMMGRKRSRERKSDHIVERKTRPAILIIH
jgi:hypothetical protein